MQFNHHKLKVGMSGLLTSPMLELFVKKCGGVER
jgi:hypothetical protein